jgi:hypothetical protein
MGMVMSIAAWWHSRVELAGEIKALGDSDILLRKVVHKEVSHDIDGYSSWTESVPVELTYFRTPSGMFVYQKQYKKYRKTHTKPIGRDPKSVYQHMRRHQFDCVEAAKAVGITYEMALKFLG